MGRATDPERIRRLNDAAGLLKKYEYTRAAGKLAERHGLSRRQAYRYLRAAEGIKQPLPVPERKIVFEVKLPFSLAERFRKLARSRGETISDLVKTALETFLRKEKGRA